MNFWLTVLTGISDPKLCLVFGAHSVHAVMYVCSDVTEVHGLNKEDAGGFTKTFLDIP